MNKLIAAIALLISTQYSSAQFDRMFLNTGFLFGTTESSCLYYNLNSIDHYENTSEFNDITGTFIRNQQIPFNLEFFTENLIGDIGFTIKPKQLVKVHKKANQVSGTDGKGFNTKLALGGYIGGVFGLFAGGQFAWAPYEINQWVDAGIGYDDIRNSTTHGTGYYVLTYSGGYQRGVGAHMVLNIKNRVALRGSFMYDWIKRKGIPGNRSWQSYLFKGNAITGEASLYVMFNEDNDFGMNFGVSYSSRNMTFGYFDDEGVYDFPLVPDHTLKSLNFNVGILIPGNLWEILKDR